MIKLGHMVLKVVNRLHDDKIRENDLERSARISSYDPERSQ